MPLPSRITTRRVPLRIVVAGCCALLLRTMAVLIASTGPSVFAQAARDRATCGSVSVPAKGAAAPVEVEGAYQRA